MKKRYKVIVASILITMFVASAFAFTNVSVKNLIETQGIDIEMDSITDDSYYAAGKCVKHEPAIINKGIDCYVRFKTVSLGGRIYEKDFYGRDKGWIKKGEYYYYNAPLKKGEKVNLYEGFMIPIQLDNEDKLEIKIIDTVEAIQSKNFKPNYESEKPWGNVAIKNSSYDGTNYVNKVSKIIPVKLDIKKEGIYRLDGNKIVDAILAPGDSYKNETVITNSNNHNVNLNFRANVNENKLLKALKVKIYNNNKLIYDGKFDNKELSKDKLIGKLKPDEILKFKYEVEADHELDNMYQNKDAEFEWIFSVTNDNTSKVQTGDNNNILVVILVMIISIIASIIVYKRVNKNEKRGK